MTRPIGRPLKYGEVLRALKDDTLYTPAKIAALALELGMIETHNKQRRDLDRQRIRIAMGRLSHNHAFPENGDGQVVLNRQRPIPGWFGWRWKKVLQLKLETVKPQQEALAG